MRTWEAIKSYSDIRFEFYEGIAKITIDREIVYNAFRPETNNQMLEAMDICREREDIDALLREFHDNRVHFSRPGFPGRRHG